MLQPSSSASACRQCRLSPLNSPTASKLCQIWQRFGGSIGSLVLLAEAFSAKRTLWAPNSQRRALLLHARDVYSLMQDPNVRLWVAMMGSFVRASEHAYSRF